MTEILRAHFSITYHAHPLEVHLPPVGSEGHIVSCHVELDGGRNANVRLARMLAGNREIRFGGFDETGIDVSLLSKLHLLLDINPAWRAACVLLADAACEGDIIVVVHPKPEPSPPPTYDLALTPRRR